MNEHGPTRDASGRLTAGREAFRREVPGRDAPGRDAPRSDLPAREPRAREVPDRLASAQDTPGRAREALAGLSRATPPRQQPGDLPSRPASRGSTPIRALVVDDSALMRQSVRRVLDADPEIEVIDVARDGLEALTKVEKLQPDVITMDVEMPNLDGLATLRLLMDRFPKPVVMLSSLTAAGAEATVRALALGAVDFMQKPAGQSGGMAGMGPELVEKVKRAARARVRKPLLSTSHPASSARAPAVSSGPSAQRPSVATPLVLGPEPDRLLIIGSSTGGPRALAEVVAELPADLPCAAIIVQHLPAGFTRSLAERLDQGSPLSIAEAKDGDTLNVGRVLIAPGDFHLRVEGTRVKLDVGPRIHGVRPAVDVTLETATQSFGPAVLAAILTGMGQDGTEGARVVKAAGGLVLAEAESTCVVYGMPRAVAEAGLADEVVPLDQMAAAIGRHIHALPPRATRRLTNAR